jgi:bacillithiol biosynthesis cysteine-adding enzyme BshC
MDCISTRLPYSQTGYFSEIILDYLKQEPFLTPFYAHPVSVDGIRSSIEARRAFPTNRPVLVNALKDQYKGITTSELVRQHIDLLVSENTFTICTAHQPAIFTGSLYFIYKILHTIRLASFLSAEFPQYKFVPVFYMGSEDADLEELGKIYLNNEKLVWDTTQTGAVGRMKPEGLEKIIDRIEGELSVLPFGKELTGLLKEAYLESPDIQTGTFKLLNSLFASYGLVVLIPDQAPLKQLMASVFADDLFNQAPSAIVNPSVRDLSVNYKVQANPREINLFYLKGGLRGRIEKRGDRFIVHDSGLSFGEAELRQELAEHPERFSPNVILRGLYQETLLPDIAFIGGGGETAYWLELKALFEHYRVPFPLLVLRNSFLLIEDTWREKLENAGLSVTDIFRPEEDLVNELVKRQSRQQLSLDLEIRETLDFYKKIKEIAGAVDKTLVQHVEALQSKAIKPLEDLEKKLLKAEKRKFEDQSRQVNSIKSALFPLNGLQERIDNFMPWYARRGPAFIDHLYAHSLALEQEFVVLGEG